MPLAPKQSPSIDEVDGGQRGYDRLAEIAALLALGVLRLKARQSSEKDRKNGDTLLDNQREESVDRTAISAVENRS